MTHLCDCSTFVVAADELYSVGIAQFEAGEERDGLDAEQAAVDIVAQEQVVRVGRVAAYAKDLDQVVELS